MAQRLELRLLQGVDQASLILMGSLELAGSERDPADERGTKEEGELPRPKAADAGRPGVIGQQAQVVDRDERSIAQPRLKDDRGREQHCRKHEPRRKSRRRRDYERRQAQHEWRKRDVRQRDHDLPADADREGPIRGVAVVDEDPEEHPDCDPRDRARHPGARAAKPGQNGAYRVRARPARASFGRRRGGGSCGCQRIQR